MAGAGCVASGQQKSAAIFSRRFQIIFFLSILFFLSACSSSDDSSSSEIAQPGKSGVQGEEVVLSVGDMTNDSALTDGSIGIELTLEWSIISRPVGSNAELSNPGESETIFIADLPGEYVIGLIIRNGTEELLNTTITVVVEASDSPDPTDPVDPTPTDPTPNDPTPTAPVKPDTHLPTSDNCLACHDQSSWAVINFDHAEAVGACVDCHNNVLAMGKTANHINTTDNCGACHINTSQLSDWMKPPSIMDHTEALGSCTSCHDHVIFPTLPADHIPITQDCGACHTTDAWTPASPPDHSSFVGNCVTCHDGIRASGKNPTHIATTDLCDACHAVFPAPWIPVASAAVDHTQVFGTCVSCHDNGATSPVKPLDHIPSTDDCGACHYPGPAPWAPASGVDHNQVLGVCSSCHDNVIANGKGASHILTSEECSVCHNTVAWIPVLEEHHLWVLNNDTDYISKVSLVDGSYEFQFVAPGENAINDSSHGLTWDGEFFWVYNISKRTLFKVNMNGAEIDSFHFSDILLGLEYANGSVWAITYDSIYQINPVDGSFSSIPSPVLAGSGIAFDGVSSLWVVGNTADDEIYTVDINTGATEYKFNSPDVCPNGLAFLQNQLYLIGCSGLTVLDSATGVIINQINNNSMWNNTGITFAPASVSAGDGSLPQPPNVQPVAVIAANTYAFVGSEVSLNGGNSYDANGDTLTYRWDFSYQPIGSTASIINDTQEIASFVPDVRGTYHVRLVVNDGALDSYPMILSINVDLAGACYSDDSCTAGSFCETPAGTCGGVGTCSYIPFACTNDYVPVCGCDGVTYPNACEAATNGVSVAYNGQCN